MTDEPIEDVIALAERRAVREWEREHDPAKRCEANGAHIGAWESPDCVVCGEPL